MENYITYKGKLADNDHKDCDVERIDLKKIYESGFGESNDVRGEGKTEDGCYDFRHKYRGLTVIISQENFTLSGNTPRPYASIEIEKMRKTFGNLGFHVVSFTDLTCKQIKRVLKAASEMKNIHNRSDCFACVIGSHGSEIPVKKGDCPLPDIVPYQQEVCGTDGSLQLEEIINLFTDANCPELCQKPKLFFIQACRNRFSQQTEDAVDRGVEIQIASQQHQPSSAQTDSPEAKGTGSLFTKMKDAFFNKFWSNQMVPVCPPHFLIMYSAPSGKYSLARRDGGWMLQSLYLGVLHYAEKLSSKQMDFVTLLSIVNAIGATYFEGHFSGNSSLHSIKSAFAFDHKLTHDIYFTPKDLGTDIEA